MGRAILAELIQGQTSPEVLADLVKGRLRTKRDDLIKALEGRVKPPRCFVLTELLCEIDNLDEAIARFDEQIQEYGRPFEEAIQHLDTIPGVARDTAEIIVAEIGVDVSRFASADHLASWSSVAPGNDESAGKTHPGNKSLRTALNQAAHTAARTKDTYFGRAVLAPGHAPGQEESHYGRSSFHLGDCVSSHRPSGRLSRTRCRLFDKCRPEITAKHLINRLEVLGYAITVQTQPAMAAA
ncbi:hypothetical protein TFLX_01851 [Thermoflexales bacterium]|nr:hypothetical protein TFLX_01851 [Thermoflexales bacterium]